MVCYIYTGIVREGCDATEGYKLAHYVGLPDMYRICIRRAMDEINEAPPDDKTLKTAVTLWEHCNQGGVVGGTTVLCFLGDWLNDNKDLLKDKPQWSVFYDRKQVTNGTSLKSRSR